MSTHFEVVEIKEGNDRFDIRQEEFKKLILSDLINCKSQIGLDGFCKGPSYNPLHQAEKPFFFYRFLEADGSLLTTKSILATLTIYIPRE